MPFSFGNFNTSWLNTPNTLREERLLSKLDYCQKTRYQNSKRNTFYLLDIQRYPDAFKLMISGSTMNVYEVTVDEQARKLSVTVLMAEDTCTQ